MKFLIPLLLTCNILFASSIYVKYFGDVNLDGFKKQSLVHSSLVKELYYNDNTQQAIVKLKNTYYMYCDIWIEEIMNWSSSSSLGRYYVKNIKGEYQCH